MSKLADNPSPGQLAISLATFVAFVMLWVFFLPNPENSNFVLKALAKPSAAGSVEPPHYAEYFASKLAAGKAHAANSYADGNNLVAFWYGGSAEGAKDVQIYRAIFSSEQWQAPAPLVSVTAVEKDLFRWVRKIGNPVGFKLPDGRIWLFFVSVSVGGWAGSSINLMESVDGGKTFGKVRKLITSPFLNISTLVRNPPFYYQDGSIGLPVYHEFLNKFGEILRLDQQARILGRTRLSVGNYSLQPSIVVLSEVDAIALLRYAGSPPMQLLQSETSDSGVSWSEPHKLNLPNPGAAIATLNIGQQHILAAINNAYRGRHDMSLAVRSNQQWRVITELESVAVSPTSHDFEFSYPALSMTNSGMIHLLYSWNHKAIKHIEFNRSWLHQKMMASGE